MKAAVIPREPLAEPSGPSGSATPRAALRGVAAYAVDRVSKVYRLERQAFEALRSVELTVCDGEFVALVGPSGCGKTTLLKILAGLMPPSAGEVSFYGSPLNGPRRDVGLMFQESTLFAWRTALKNVLLPVEVERRARSDDILRARELLKLVQLEGFEHYYQHELSGGMQQRVALARVLMLDPKVMLLDEPFGALDEFTREALNLELATIIADEGRTVVLVTHNIAEAIFLADRVVAMTTNPGQVAGEVAVPEPLPRSLSFARSDLFREITMSVRQFLGLE